MANLLRPRFALAPTIASILCVATLGVVHGVYSDRWGPSDRLQQALQMVPRIPTQIANWEGEDLPYEPEDMIRAGIKGSVYRRYKNRRTGELVSCLLVCGRGGPISVHTPDVCYTSAGYQMTSAPQSRVIQSTDGATATFHLSQFGKPRGLVPSQLDIYWAWSRDGALWEAPASARLSLARCPALYKLYVVCEVPPTGQASKLATGERFLKEGLPAVRQSLSFDIP
jgi:hypothetical protein